MYEPRNYRKNFLKERFTFAQVTFKEIDLYIGVDKGSYVDEIPDYIKNFIVSLREELDEYIEHHPEFKNSDKSIKPDENAPLIAKDMIKASTKAEIGPMSAVAGGFAETVGLEIIKLFEVDELVVENGGDIFMYLTEDLNISIYAGDSELSEKIGIKVPASYTPLSVCTSSGTVGHSFSYGKADAVMISCKSAFLADSYATAFCNKIHNEDDVDRVINEIKNKADILSAVIIKNKKSGACGRFELFFNN